MSIETDEFIAILRDRMKEMAPDDRLNILYAVIDGYCRECGCEDPAGTCQCWNDE